MAAKGWPEADPPERRSGERMSNAPSALRNTFFRQPRRAVRRFFTIARLGGPMIPRHLGLPNSSGAWPDQPGTSPASISSAVSGPACAVSSPPAPGTLQSVRPPDGTSPGCPEEPVRPCHRGRPETTAAASRSADRSRDHGEPRQPAARSRRTSRAAASPGGSRRPARHRPARAHGRPPTRPIAAAGLRTGRGRVGHGRARWPLEMPLEPAAVIDELAGLALGAGQPAGHHGSPSRAAARRPAGQSRDADRACSCRAR